MLRMQVKQILQMSDKIRADLLIDYLRQVLPEQDGAGNEVEISGDLEWHNTLAEFKHNGIFLKSHPASIENTTVYLHVANVDLPADGIEELVFFCYLQLIYDVLSNRAQNEHIAPAINKLMSKQSDIREAF